jgi:predicted ATPase
MSKKDLYRLILERRAANDRLDDEGTVRAYIRYIAASCAHLEAAYRRSNQPEAQKGMYLRAADRMRTKLDTARECERLTKEGV